MQFNYRVLGGICLLLIIGCKPSTTLRVIEPAELIFPEHIYVMAIIDRSRPASGYIDNIESNATGELIDQDKNGRKKAIQALANRLERTPRFEIVRSTIELTGTESGSSFAPPLDLDQLRQLNYDLRADAIIALEKFDSNNFSEVKSRKTKTKDKEGNGVEKTVYDAEGTVDVHLGWRVYDLVKNELIDETDVTDAESDRSTGKNSKKEALDGLTGPFELMYRVADKAGVKYAERIAPIWRDVHRQFYPSVKGDGKEEMEIASRYFRAEDVLEASKIWEEIIEGDYPGETKGKAAFNLAVAYEKKGLLERAMEWARTAYAEYGVKKARNYIKVLLDRIEDQKELNVQMGNNQNRS